MKKILLLLVFCIVAATVGAQPPPPPPPPPLPPGTGISTPIDTDLLYLLIPTLLFSVYSLNKKRFTPIIISKK